MSLPSQRKPLIFGLLSARVGLCRTDFADFDSAIRRFESSRPSQPVLSLRAVRYLSGNLKHFRELDAHFGSLPQLSAHFRVRSTYFSAKVSNPEFSISDFLLQRLGSNLSETGSIRKADVTKMVFHQMGEEGEKARRGASLPPSPKSSPEGNVSIGRRLEEGSHIR